ncbi:MAG: rRNA maturation RNase YbeY [Lentimicrobiaceae bacterium]|nr:rRNA maturation RNase YbeY [Lentimicrobiaceae bacterium]
MISFFYEDITFSLKRKNNVKCWIKSVIQKYGITAGDINYIFCSDEYLLEKNISYLKHNTLTDIITFNYNENKKISGDIFISIYRVKENAENLSIPFDDELERVMIHGILHLLGFKDKTKRDKMEMRRMEDECLMFHVKRE